jgi:hypothetical protein
MINHYNYYRFPKKLPKSMNRSDNTGVSYYHFRSIFASAHIFTIHLKIGKVVFPFWSVTLKIKYLCGQYEMPQTRIRDGGVGNIQLSTKKLIWNTLNPLNKYNYRNFLDSFFPEFQNLRVFISCMYYLFEKDMICEDQCSRSGSVCFWASWNRIRIRIRPSTIKKWRKTLISFLVTSLWLFVFEE